MRIFLPCKETRRRIMHDVATILHLPLFARLMHHKARRPLFGFGLGCGIMLAGSAIAASVKHMDTLSHLTHVVVDTCGYLLHGIGAVPIVKHIEPVWAIVFGAAQEA